MTPTDDDFRDACDISELVKDFVNEKAPDYNTHHFASIMIIWGMRMLLTASGGHIEWSKKIASISVQRAIKIFKSEEESDGD